MHGYRALAVCTPAATARAAAEPVENDLELAAEVVAEDAVEDGVGGAVDVRQRGGEDVEDPRSVEPGAGEEVVEQHDLMRGVAQEVDGDTGHQHLDNTFPGADSLAVSSHRSAPFRTRGATYPSAVAVKFLDPDE